jgi:uncharacterized protein YutE (UPF0331/DUF86 family)
VKDELRENLDSVRYSLRTARNVAEPVYVENEYLREALDALHSAVEGLADIVERLIDDEAAG